MAVGLWMVRTDEYCIQERAIGVENLSQRLMNLGESFLVKQASRHRRLVGDDHDQVFFLQQPNSLYCARQKFEVGEIGQVADIFYDDTISIKEGSALGGPSARIVCKRDHDGQELRPTDLRTTR